MAAGSGEIRALFNPNKLTLRGSTTVQSRANASPGKAMAVDLADYTYEPLTLSISLFFDTSETATGGELAELFGPGAGNSGNSVLPYTTSVAALLRPVTGMTRPPICELWWGRYQILRGALASVSQNFTHFMADEGARCGAANGAHGAAEDGITGNAADYGADASAHLGVGGVGCTTTQCQGRSAGSRKKNVTDVHGEIP